MKTMEYTFLAGETKVLPGGIFFALVNAVSGVDVDYFKNNVNNGENAVNVTAGYFYQNLDQGFDSVRVTSAVAQTVKFAVSRGKGGFNVGSSIITGGQLDTIVNPLHVDNTFHLNLGQSYFNSVSTSLTLAANWGFCGVINLSPPPANPIYITRMRVDIKNTYSLSMPAKMYVGAGLTTIPPFTGFHHKQLFNGSVGTYVTASLPNSVAIAGSLWTDIWVPSEGLELIKDEPLSLSYGDLGGGLYNSFGIITQGYDINVYFEITAT